MRKRAVMRMMAAMCAVACAMALGAGAAFGLQAVPGADALRTAADEPFLAVYTQDGDEGAPVLAKEFTEEELTAIAANNTDAYATMYIGHGVRKVVASNCYVTLAQLLADAGLSDVYDNALTGVNVKDGGGSSPDATPLRRDLDKCCWFYPNVTFAETHSEGGYEIPPVLALTSQSKELTDQVNTAGDLAQSIVKSQTWANGRNAGTRFLWGMSPKQLEADSAAGNRLWSNVRQLVLIKHAGEIGSVTAADQTYTGSALTPALTVKGTDGKVLAAGADYTVQYANNTNVGTASVSVTGKNRYLGSASATFKIVAPQAEQAAPQVTDDAPTAELAANPVKVKAKKLSVKYGKQKKFSAKKAFSVKNNKGGKATYKKLSGSKLVKVASNGKVTVKPGLKKGRTYKVKVKVSFKATSTCKAASKTLKLSIKVK